MDCKNALKESEGDLEGAIVFLRKKGAAKAEKKLDRETGEGKVGSYIHAGGKIGVLGRQFDSMTAEVHEARQALLDQSFKAGKADTAAEVLHNIRNAMTPMINGLERLRKSFKVVEKLRINEATTQVASPDCSPDRKEKFLKYINASFAHVESVGTDATEDLNVVTAQAKQVEGILSDQEKFANVAPVAENVTINELLDEATNVIPKENSQSIGQLR